MIKPWNDGAAILKKGSGTCPEPSDGKWPSRSTILPTMQAHRVGPFQKELALAPPGFFSQRAWK